jgi:hypothetical protein
MGIPPAVPMVTSLVGDGNDLSLRVERLLSGGTPAAARRRTWPAILLTLSIAGLAVQPGTYVAAHRVLEALAH